MASEANMNDPEVTAAPTDPQEALRMRLEAARAKAEAARAAVAPSLEDQVAAAELEAANAEAIAAAAAKLGKLDVDFAVVPAPGGRIVIVKVPDSARFSAFQDLKDPKLQDMDEMGSRCVVYPDAASYRALVAQRPGMIGGVAVAAARLAGVAIDGKLGK